MPVMEGENQTPLQDDSRFENVSFQYEQNQRDVIHDVSFYIPEKEMTAMLATKVQKFGAVIIWGVIVGLLYLVLGMALTLPFFVAASIIAQFILSKSGYKSMKAAIGSYVLISIFSIGGYAQLFLFTDQYLEEAARRGLSDAFVSGLESYSTIGFLLIMMVATAICALLGCMFAKAVLKKHLSKAGVL